MGLFIKESNGTYVKATTATVLKEAQRVAGYALRSGAAITSSAISRMAISAKLSGFQNEVFACLFLDTQHKIITFEILFEGTINTTKVYPRILVKKVLEYNATAVIIAHNHPSGVMKFSPSDITLTKELKELMGLIDVVLLDHILVGETTESMMDLGIAI